MSDSEKAEMGLCYGKRFRLGSQPERKNPECLMEQFRRTEQKAKMVTTQGIISTSGC